MSGKTFCFVFMGNLYLCPYIQKYLGLLDYDYDVLYWNRDGIEERTKARNVHRFDFRLRLGDSQFRKLQGYWAFRKYASRVLTETSYDGIILLQSLAGVLLGQVLERKYFKRYILDVRDYTLEQNRLFYQAERKVVNASAMTVISSEGYRTFLPPHEYVMAHNSQPIDDQLVGKIRSRDTEREKLVVASIGYQAYQEQHKKLLRILGNDQRFELQFIGKESERLVTFCKENDIRNVRIVGQFQPEDVVSFYEGVDIVNNWYGNNTPTLDYALSNKLYFAAQLHIPILVSKSTYMERVAVGGGFGYSMDVEGEDSPDLLYNYYQNIDWTAFANSCDFFMERVLHEDQESARRLRGFFEGVTR